MFWTTIYQLLSHVTAVLQQAWQARHHPLTVQFKRRPLKPKLVFFPAVTMGWDGSSKTEVLGLSREGLTCRMLLQCATVSKHQRKLKALTSTMEKQPTEPRSFMIH